MNRSGGWSKLREIVRVLTKHRIATANELTRKLISDAKEEGSRSPFRRSVANDDGTATHLALEYDTVLAHVRFAEKLDVAVYRAGKDEYLPGLEPKEFEFSENAIDDRIVAFLEKRGISLRILEKAVDAIPFHDVDSIIEFLKDERRLQFAEEEFRRCVRLLGECGISLMASRRKTYAITRPKQMKR